MFIDSMPSYSFDIGPLIGEKMDFSSIVKYFFKLMRNFVEVQGGKSKIFVLQPYYNILQCTLMEF